MTRSSRTRATEVQSSDDYSAVSSILRTLSCVHEYKLGTQYYYIQYNLSTELLSTSGTLARPYGVS